MIPHSTIFILNKEDVGLIPMDLLTSLIGKARLVASCQTEQENYIIKSNYRDKYPGNVLDDVDLMQEILNNLKEQN